MPNRTKKDQRTHCEVGSLSHAAVVLSVRGRAEERAGHSAAGVTGTVLAKLGEALALMGSGLLRRRGEYTITNAHSGIEYDALTGRSEVSRKEIVEDPANLQRLAAEIGHITDVIFVCGDRAEWAVEALRAEGMLHPEVRIVRLPHLALRSLNQIKVDLLGHPILPGCTRSEQRQNTERRVEVVAAGVLAQLK